MEKLASIEEADERAALHPPSSDAPSNTEPEQVAPIKYSIVSRHGAGTAGKRMSFLANHFQVSINVPDAIFFQYSVCLPFSSL